MTAAARRLSSSRASVLLPTIGTSGLRVGQLLLLLALSAVATGAERDILIVGFGLIASFTMLTDSGAANFVLSGGVDTGRRPVVTRAIAFHVATTTIGLLCATALTVASDGRALALTWPTFAALAVTQLADSTSRIVRSPHMAARRDLRYAVPDLLLVAVKLPLIGLAYFSHSAFWLLLLPIPSLVQVLLSWRDVQRFLPVGGPAPKRLVVRIAEYGVTGALNAFYTQVPLLYSAAFWTPAVAAQVSVAYRIVQAFDLLPGTASLQLIPRIRRGSMMWRFWFVFLAGGAIISGVAIALLPLIDAVLGSVLVDGLLFTTVALAFVPRSGNYALMAIAMGSGRIRDRLIATISTCVLALAVVVAVAQVGGPQWFGLSTFTIELCFSVIVVALLTRSLRRSRRAADAVATETSGLHAARVPEPAGPASPSPTPTPVGSSSSARG
jgi:hypothetical protein